MKTKLTSSSRFPSLDSRPGPKNLEPPDTAEEMMEGNFVEADALLLLLRRVVGLALNVVVVDVLSNKRIGNSLVVVEAKVVLRLLSVVVEVVEVAA